MKVDGRPRAPLPVDRAFVVQLRGDADLGIGSISGRVEHVSSGTAALFDSVVALVEFMRAHVGTSSARAVRGPAPHRES